MARYVLVSDTTLSYEYRSFPLLDFLPCAPRHSMPKQVYYYLKGRKMPEVDGRALIAPYAIRKLEATLLQRHSPDEVAIPHDDHIERFITDETEVIGVTTMDPLGLGPLTMSYAVIFGGELYPYVTEEFEALMSRISQARKGKKAKLIVGGPGVWEFMLRPEDLDRFEIDYAFQGEADDIVCELFQEVSEGSLSNNRFFNGFQTFDDNFHKTWSAHEKFVSRRQFSKQYPKLEEIPNIVNPSIKAMVEVMRGCGIGCDFCEVTLRPLRYYPPEKVRKELLVNTRAGYSNAWLHGDEIFAYKHGRNFEPNSDALTELFSEVMGTKGMRRTNPTHGRISVPAGYPELIGKMSYIMKTGSSNWIGMQVGIETGSETLAKLHMPNKTLPLKIGPDGSWPSIVWQGTHNLNRCYWRPAFTVQVGQPGETPEDNWETVALVNWMSKSEVDGRPFEFTATPMVNVPLGLLKSRNLSSLLLDESQLAVFYACYRHLAKITSRGAFSARGSGFLSRMTTGAIIRFGGWGMLQFIKRICIQRGVNIDKVESYYASKPLARVRQ